MITPESLTDQEIVFARAFAAHDLEIARPLYAFDVIYVSPTVRLFNWPARIEGVDRALAFIAKTIERCERITYRAVETAIVADGTAAFVRVQFDWTSAGRRLRSNYLVLYRHRGGRIAEQEIYYDPSAAPEIVEDVTALA